jgi:hypothetical protein
MNKVILAALAGMFTLGLVGCEQRLDADKTPAGETTSTTILRDDATTPATTAPGTTTTTPDTITTPTTPSTTSPTTAPDTRVDVNVKPDAKPVQ